MNKISIIAAIVGTVSLLSVATPVEANFFGDVKNAFNRTENRKDNREERRDDRQDKREDFKEDFREKMASRPGFVKAFKKIRFSFGNGKITAISGTTLTVEKDGKSYTVLTGTFDTCTTAFKRRFWGNSSLSEYTVGDMVNVVGKFQDEGKTTIEACVIRDISIQKRFGVFVGEVISLTTDGWVMKTVSNKRDNQTVTVSSSTKFVNRKEEGIVKADIQVGHKVRIKGLWNRLNNTVTEVTHVKDFSLPIKLSITPTPTVMVTVTPTPSPVVTATPTATPTP
jgi:hypothetical protein